MTSAAALTEFDRSATSVAVSIRHVSKRFPVSVGQPLIALENISFDLVANETLALLGPSGCGKSTLLNIIAGIQSADTGTVTVAGKPVSVRELPSLGYVFQEDRLLPWRSALRNVTFSLEAGATPAQERERRAREALALVGLDAFADAYPHQLSGGMRSRVALARSLVLNPTILLMDEPFSRLDAQTRAQMHQELLRLKVLLGISILFVTHDVEESVVLADRVIVLEPRPGRIKAVVPVDLSRPRDTSAAGAARAVQHLKGLIG